MVKLLNILALTLGIARIAVAAVPNEITVQGVLRDGMGNFQSMPVDLTVKFFDSETGGQMLTNPYVAKSVPVAGGLFSQVITDKDLIANLSTASSVWMEVTVTSAGVTDIFARQKITPTVFALMCSTADNATHATTADNALQLNGVPASAWASASSVTNAGDGYFKDSWPKPESGWNRIGNPVSLAAHGKGFFMVVVSGYMCGYFYPQLPNPAKYAVALQEVGGGTTGKQTVTMSRSPPSIEFEMEPFSLTWIVPTSDTATHTFSTVANIYDGASNGDGWVEAGLNVLWFPSP
jgi:hypothetical protein